MNPLLVLGAGGHGRVVADAAAGTGNWSAIAFLDDRFPELKHAEEWAVHGTIATANTMGRDYRHAFVAIGDYEIRLSLLSSLSRLGFELPVIAHKAAVISRRASVGRGTVIMAQAVVSVGAVLGDGVIINHGATIDHDCRLALGVHVCPGGHLAGNVTIGTGSWIGVGASVREGISIGAGVVVGAGAAVISDQPDGVVVSGVPAKRMSAG